VPRARQQPCPMTSSILLATSPLMKATRSS
jgi:hypothetical protein